MPAFTRLHEAGCYVVVECQLSVRRGAAGERMAGLLD